MCDIWTIDHKSRERHGGYLMERGWCSCLLKVPVKYTWYIHFLISLIFNNPDDKLGEWTVKTLGCYDKMNQKQNKQTEGNLTQDEVQILNWINHTCRYAVGLLTGFMIKIPRRGSILNGLGSKFNTSGLNIQRWKMTSGSIFNPIQNTSLHRIGITKQLCFPSMSILIYIQVLCFPLFKIGLKKYI